MVVLVSLAYQDVEVQVVKRLDGYQDSEHIDHIV